MLETTGLWTDDFGKRHGITFQGYLFLISIFWDHKWKYITFSDELIEILINKKLITKDDEDKIILTEKGNAIFVPEESLFETFLATFPTRVVDTQGKSRVLSPASINAGMGQRLFKTWYSITKNDKKKEQHLIRCLKEEVELRRKTGNLFYMRTAEQWLDKATWEDYEYLLEKEQDGFTTSRDISL
jgi:hypothetical protein